MSDLVSVIIPTYNRRHLVQLAIDSVLQQTFRDFEIIVVDDGSNDGTAMELQRYGEQIRYVYQQNQGASAARNRGIRLARGEWLAFLDSDDLWLPHKLERQLQELTDAPGTGLVFGQAAFMDAAGTLLPALPLGHNLRQQEVNLDRLLLGNIVSSSPSGVLVQKTFVEKAGAFDEHIHYAEDWDLWIRLAALGCHFRFIPQVLVLIRRHTGGQFPPPDGVDRMMQEHVAIVQKAYDSACDRVKRPEVPKSRALARVYANAALTHYFYANVEKGAELLSRAASDDPSAWANEVTIRRFCADFAFSLENGQSLETSLRFLNTVYGNLPSELRHIGRAKRRAIGCLYAAKGFSSYYARDLKGARSALLRAIGADPGWLANRGVLSIIVRSLVCRR